jgi:hypothetical protein
MNRVLAAAAVLLLLATSAAAIGNTEVVRLIESRVVMPPGAEPLPNYDRYYLPKTLGGVEVIQGRFLLRSLGVPAPEDAAPVPDVPGAFTIPRGGQLPRLEDDPGCGVVSIYYDVGSRKLVRLEIKGRGEPGRAVCGQIP